MQSSLLAMCALSEGALSLSRGPDLTRYLAVCLGMLALVVGLGWGFRRILAQRFALHAARRSLAVIDVLPLGGRRQLSVVRCYDRTFVLGLGEKEVRMIAELDPVVGSERVPAAPALADSTAFSRMLQGARERMGIAGQTSHASRSESEHALDEVVA
jgi:flagellar biogenesis protein FliO